MKDTLQSHLRTKRLSLRPLNHEDAQDITQPVSNPAIAHMIGSVGLPYVSHAAEMWILISKLNAQRGRVFLYGLCLAKTDRIIGVASIISSGASTNAQETWELGYWLGQPYWHQGLMREAIAAILTEADAKLNAPYLSANVYHDNPRSLALLKSFGFTETRAPVPVFCIARDRSVLSLNLRREKPPLHDQNKGLNHGSALS